MPFEIKGDLHVRGHTRSRHASLESSTTETSEGGILDLVDSSPSNVFLTGSAENFSVRLGTADSYEVGHFYDFLNESSKTIFIHDFSGNLLDSVTAGTSLRVRLEEALSAEGKWFFDRIQLSKVLIDTTRIPEFSGQNTQSFIENFLAQNGIPVIGEEPSGVKDGENIFYETQSKFISGTLEVYLGALRLTPEIDYQETIDSQGFAFIIDTADRNRLSSPPLNFEDLLVNYKRQVIFP